MKYILFFVILSLALYSKSNVKTELISEYEHISQGMQFKVAVKMTMKQNWYTYWKNPGDAGLATHFEWGLPDNVKLIDEKWETPEKIFFQDMASYGYKNETFFYFTFQHSDEDHNKSEIKLKVKSNWLECKEKCVAGESFDSIMIKITDKPIFSESTVFQNISSKTPEENTQWKFSAIRKSKSVILNFHNSDSKNTEFDNVIFIPYDNGIFSNGTKQKLTKTGDKYSLELMLDPLRMEEPKILKGILIADGSFFSNKENNSIEVEAIIKDE
jgi:DsbC/DsbD-like thiol-disulfide interchange protein